MKILLDTHTFLWWDIDPNKLSARARELCANQANIIILSVASVWEMTIKLQVGKLQLRRPLAAIIAEQQKVNDLHILSINLAHIHAIEMLPLIHKDPFDRLLIAQAQTENIAIISRDSVFQKYPVVVEW